MRIFGPNNQLAGLLVLTVAAAWCTVGCKSPTSSSQTTSEKRQQQSAISTSIDAAGFHLGTPTAEFLLNSSGYLRASLKSNGQFLTLDDSANQTGQLFISGKSEVNDFVFDIANTKITDAAGKLGALGKRIEF